MTDTTAVAEQSPKQETELLVVIAVKGGGSVIANVTPLVHPIASVVMTVYVAVQRFPQDCALHPPGVHK
jgi:hypothetical protein